MYLFITAIYGHQSPCDREGQTNNLPGCLTAIRDRATDPAYFWFGTKHLDLCPPPLSQTINCWTNLQDFPYTLADLVFAGQPSDLTTLDRFLHIKYTSAPGRSKKGPQAR